MTFEEWWENSWWKSCAEKGDVFRVWQAATLAERERAAKVADDIADRASKGGIFVLSDVPDAIRKGEGV